MRVEARVVDTSAHRTRADAHANTSRSMSHEIVPGAQVELKTTPQRPSQGEAPCAKESPRTAHMPSRKQFNGLCCAPVAHAHEEQGDDGDDGDDEARKEWRKRMVFRDLLREFYPRYGVPLKDEFGDSFKAARTEPTFSAFPKPGVCGVGFC